MKSPVKFLFALLLFTFQIHAQSNGSIKGTVVSSENHPLEKVTVTAQNASFSTLTDNGGNFTITNVKPGTYTLIFSHIGFTAVSVQINVASGVVTNVPKVHLTESLNTLSEVIVSGSVINKTIANGKAGIKTIDLPQSVQVVDSKILEQQQTIRLSDVVKKYKRGLRWFCPWWCSGIVLVKRL
jgi:iron complex outermembrane receptor protein